MIGEKFEHTAVKHNGSYRHFGIHPKSASLYGDDPNDIEIVLFEISNQQAVPDCQPSELTEVDYWGYYDFERKYWMIYPQYFLLNMSFPNGIKVCEDRKQGKAYRLIIKDTKKLNNK